MKTYDIESNTLIDDKGIVSLAKSDQKPIEQWKLADWIEDMKTWPGSPEELGLKKYGERKLAEHKSTHYKKLAVHMEYYLLHKRELESQIYSDQLIGATPQSKLMLASHDFITRYFWPVLGWLWKPLCSDADFLWGLFEYSLCYNSFCSSLKGKRDSKKTALSNLYRATKNYEHWLRLTNYHFQNPVTRDIPEQVKNKPTLPDSWLKVDKDFRKNPEINLYKLVFVQTEGQIAINGDKTLLDAYLDYVVRAWSRYREEVLHSKDYGFWYLQSLDYEPRWSETLGRPPKSKKIQPKPENPNPRKPGPVIGSKRKSCNGL